MGFIKLRKRMARKKLSEKEQIGLRYGIGLVVMKASRKDDNGLETADELFEWDD